MEKVHSHYDNLKVTRNAPVEVIRAAYRAMASKYHPDVNSSPGANNTMRILNEAWDTLSDPTKRAEHDRWIQKEEEKMRAKVADAYNASKPSAAKTSGQSRDADSIDPSWQYYRSGDSREPGRPSRPTRSSSSPTVPPTQKASSKLQWAAVIIFLVAVGWFFYDSIQPADEWSGYAIPVTSQPVPVNASGVAHVGVAPKSEPAKDRKPSGSGQSRPSLDANSSATTSRVPSGDSSNRGGVAAPRAQELQASTPKFKPFSGELDPERQDKTGYLKGAYQQAPAGLSTFTVDNQKGSADAIARIYLGGSKPAVRSMYVKVGERFTAKDLAPGLYIFRYQFVGSQDTFEADNPFHLQETTTDEGTRYSNVRVTLFRVSNGNLKTKRVSSDQF